MSISTDYPPGTLLDRPDGMAGVVLTMTDDEAVVTITHGAGGVLLVPPQVWSGEPANLPNCWNVASP